MAEGGVSVRTRSAEQPRTHQPARRRRWLRRALLVGGPLLLAVILLVLWLTGGGTVSTENAFIQADQMTVAAQVGGPVADVAVHENQRVRKGQLLLRIDDRPYVLALERARADLDETRVQLLALQANWRQSQADIAQAESDLAFAQRELARQTALARSDVASRSALDQARRNADSAAAHLSALRQAADGVRAQLGGDPARPVEQHPRYLAAQAALGRAQYDLSQTQVRAPYEGIATNVEKVQPGDILAPGTPAFTLVGTRLWVDANPKETALTYVRPGQPAEVTVDTYPGRVWHASVASVSPATGAQFSVLPPENATGNWVKVVQRVPVRLDLDVPPGSPQLSAGMSVEVSIRTGHQRHLGDLFRDLFG